MGLFLDGVNDNNYNKMLVTQSEDAGNVYCTIRRLEKHSSIRRQLRYRICLVRSAEGRLLDEVLLKSAVWFKAKKLLGIIFQWRHQKRNCHVHFRFPVSRVQGTSLYLDPFPLPVQEKNSVS